MAKFRTKFIKRDLVYDYVEQKEHELHDSLRPFSVSEQVQRFTQAGLQLEATRRRELASIREDVDDPEDFETALDQEHLTPGDLMKAQQDYGRKIKQRSIEKNANETGAKPVGNPVSSTSDGTEPKKSEVKEERG